VGPGKNSNWLPKKSHKLVVPVRHQMQKHHHSYHQLFPLHPPMKSQFLIRPTLINFMNPDLKHLARFVIKCWIIHYTNVVLEQRQSDYMRVWLNEKRAQYLNRLVDMKAGPPAQDPICLRCGTGRPIWRCKDCSDKTPVCVLCCRDAHKYNIFHRVEKWNGRY
jgi:hypothetical protein